VHDTKSFFETDHIVVALYGDLIFSTPLAVQTRYGSNLSVARERFVLFVVRNTMAGQDLGVVRTNEVRPRS